MKGWRRLATCAWALGGLASVNCGRRQPPPPPPVQAPPARPLDPWTWRFVGGLLVVEGEVDQPTDVTLKGRYLASSRRVPLGPVRWELYRPPPGEVAELRNGEGKLLARWDFDAPQPRPEAKAPVPAPVKVEAKPPVPPKVASVQPVTAAKPVTVPAPKAVPAAVPKPVSGAAPGPAPAPRPGPVAWLKAFLAKLRPSASAAKPLPGDVARPILTPVPAPKPAVPKPAIVPAPAPAPKPAPPAAPKPVPALKPVPAPASKPGLIAWLKGLWVKQNSSARIAKPAALPAPAPAPKAVPLAVPKPAPLPAPVPAPKPIPAPKPLPVAVPQPQPAPVPRQGPLAWFKGILRKFRPGQVAKPVPAPKPIPAPTPVPVVPAAKPVPAATPVPVAAPKPVPAATPVPVAAAKPVPAPVPAPAPKPLPAPAPKPVPVPRPAPVPAQNASALWPGAGEGVNLVRGPKGGRRICMTFDGGSSCEVAAEILELLRQRGIRTTFFLTGVFVQKYPDLVRRIVRDGHEVGNHSLNHPHLAPGMKRDPGWTRERFQQELLEADRAFQQLLGRPMDPLWRAPYGEQTLELRKWAEELGYRHVAWSEGADTLDWATVKERKLYRTGETILKRLYARMEKQDGDGLIVLMHLGSGRPEEDRPSKVLGPFLDRAARDGWHFVTVGEYVKSSGRPSWDPARRKALLARAQ